jgi:7-carboxy-7-deazaguanine synthase
LLQDETSELASRLIDQGKQVLVETNGTKNIDILPEPVIRIMDIKCPGSGESASMDWNNITRLRQHDNIKFVISSREDFDWSIDIIKKYNLLSKASVLFSPAFSLLKPIMLAEWLLEISLPIRLQLQLHKYIWNPNQRGV